jgi:hypothetical protein
MKSSKIHATVEQRQAESLAKRVYLLKEPWRGRFLYEITRLASTSRTCRSLETVSRCLENRDVYAKTQSMLRSWNGI